MYIDVKFITDNESDINFSDDEDDTFDVPKKSKSKAKGKKGTSCIIKIQFILVPFTYEPL